MKQSKKKVGTFEELLMNMVTEAFEAIHMENDFLFDSIIESIEIMLKVVPPMYEDFYKEKQNLYQVANENFKQSAIKAQSYNDELYSEFIKGREDADISWSYRKDILEAILNTLAKYNKISFANRDYASLQSMEQQPAPEIPQEIPQELPQELPQPTPQITQEQQPEPQQPEPIEEPNNGPEEISDEQLKQLLAKNKKATEDQQSKPKKSKWASLMSNKNP